jgi:hypothetical protein
MVVEDYYGMSLNDKYFKWLLGILGFKEFTSCRYISMLSYLYSVDFKLTDPIVGHDDNRLNDGFELRADYSNSFTDPDLPDIFGEPVSVLEVLVAFARRIDDDIMYDGTLHASKWFFIMIDNLGMTNFTDDRLGIDWTIDDVEQIINIWMSRQFDFDGTGSIFPVKTTTFDQRNVEMWYQMQEWFNENY